MDETSRSHQDCSRAATRSTVLVICAAMFSALGLAGCGNGDDGKATTATPAALRCDDSIQANFKPDTLTTVRLVKAFKKGDPLLLSGEPNEQTQRALADLCLVKLNIGPGHAGPASAPSTSDGIGVEIWLPTPEHWNGRFHATAGGGWVGYAHQSTSAIGSGYGSDLRTVEAIAGSEGAITASTDTGHTDPSGSGSFAMNPDGTVNTKLWTDFSVRAMHEMVVKTKALSQAYYGKVPTYSYWDSGSTGGRQAMKMAQQHPEDFDGILSAFPAFNWSQFITAELYPQIVLQRDLVDAGLPLPSREQLDLVSNAAIDACDVVAGQHMGYVVDPAQCRYDPTRDPGALCVGAAGSSGVVGTNATTACVDFAQANAINKIWYGMTADGSVPDPALDNGWANTPSGGHRWYGVARGTALCGVFGLACPEGPFTVSTDQVALELQSASLAQPNFKNATGNGADAWKAMSYAQLSDAFDQGLVLQPMFADINTNDPDLSRAKVRGTKILHYHGLHDELIMPQGSTHYYERVLRQMGGLANVQSFYRLFLIPGIGHSTPNGSANAAATPPGPSAAQMYGVLTNWVEKGQAPDQIRLHTFAGRELPTSQLVCAYPKKPSYGTGDPQQAASYTCQ